MTSDGVGIFALAFLALAMASLTFLCASQLQMFYLKLKMVKNRLAKEGLLNLSKIFFKNVLGQFLKLKVVKKRLRF